MTDSWFRARSLGALALTCATLAWSPSSAAAADVPQPTFATPEAAVTALITAVKAGSLDDVLAIFGPGGRDLVDSSDPATGRRNREGSAYVEAHFSNLDRLERAQVTDEKPLPGANTP